MSEEYKKDLLAALREIRDILNSGRTDLADKTLAALIGHVEAKETTP